MVEYKIHSNGNQYWTLNGKCRREDGPAIIYSDSTREWYLNDECIRSMKEYQEQLNLSDEDITALILKYGDIK